MKSYKNDFDELKKIPRTSGIYYFYDEDENIIYIGKADILHSRVLAHFKNYSLIKEIEFFVKRIETQGFSIQEEKKLPKELLSIWKRLIERTRSSNSLVIDEVFDKVVRIEIEEMTKELTEDRENELIKKFQPIYNSESNSMEYNDIKYG